MSNTVTPDDKGAWRIQMSEPKAWAPDISAALAHVADLAAHVGEAPVALIMVGEHVVTSTGAADDARSEMQAQTADSGALSPPDQAQAGIQAIAECPIMGLEGPIGAILLCDRTPKRITQDRLSRLEGLAAIVATVLRADLAVREAHRLDPATGVFDCEGFLAQAEERLKGEDAPLTLVLFEIDAASSAESATDDLAALMPKVRAMFEADALLGRVGDRMVAALERTDAINLHRLAGLRRDTGPQKLFMGLCHRADLNGGGIAALREGAETALSAARDRDRDGRAVYTAELDRTHNVKALRARFEAALVADEIEPFFQPILCLATGRIAGFEALARWRDEQRGLLTPKDFSRILTDPGTAQELTHRMLHRSLSAMQEWRRRGARALPVAINTTHFDLADPDFVDDVDWLLVSAGLEWRDLVFEVAPSAQDHDNVQVLRPLTRIAARGGGVTHDGLGDTGASLTPLREWPITTLKLDASIAADEAFLHAMITLAEKLDIRVVVKGIEHEETAQCVLEAGCTLGQGHHFHRPMDRDAAFAMQMATWRLHLVTGHDAR
ncbi:MAG: EAL domain-containing protein [Pseudomonadota bacterium]